VLAALFFGLLWRPRGWAGMAAAALIAFAAISSEILAFVYAPQVLLRLIALPRWHEQAVVCLLLAAGFCWAVITGTRQSRIFIAVALTMGLVQAFVAATLVPLVIRQHDQYNFEGGSRYATMPIIAPQALAAVAALACVLVLGWLPDYRLITQRHFWGYWQPKATRMLTDCEHSSSGDISLWEWGNSRVTVSCSRLHK
jgi:hypothetical protein